MRLLCLPYGGGGASIFHRWPDGLPDDIEVCPVQLPARHNRLNEPGLTSVSAIVARVAIALEQLVPAPVALYGHSFGALLAFELTRRLEQANSPPVHLIVAGRSAPQLASTRPPIAHLPDMAFCQALQERYGAGQMLSKSVELREIALPSLRADLAANEAYRYTDSTPLTTPMTALGSRQDRSVTAEALMAWRATTRGAYTEHWIDAGHFFVDTHRAWVLERVTEALAGDRSG
ncbi:MAG: alpha/beta fold hydrolase [Proteobacteria bacterium]|nr:alpha/beta fold hydrolase [Pseudomonadota bacterium]